MSTPTLVILNEQQLRQLSRIIHLQEAENTQNIIFTSESELATYLLDSRDNFQSVIGLLDGVVDLNHKFQNDNVRSSIAHDMYSYVEYAANCALQTVPNYTLRKDYLMKITEHVTSFTTELQASGRSGNDQTNLELLAMEVVHSRDSMLDYITNYQSSASHNFSNWIKDTGMTFQELVQRYQNMLGFKGPFTDLKDTEKLQVYNQIIEASGRRGRNTRSQVSGRYNAGGVAVRLFEAGMMAWEIFSAGNVLEAATRTAVEAVASVGGAKLGAIVGAALATKLTGAQASTLFVVTAGIAGSIAGAFIIGVFAGWIMNLIFNSGGTAPLTSTEGYQAYVAPMPDGRALAFRISHQTN